MGGRGPIRWLHVLGLGTPDPDEGVELELQHHIDEATDRLVDEGWDAAEAREEARRRFGDARRYANPMKRMERRRMTMERVNGGWEIMRQGTRSIARSMRRQPGFVAAIVLTLGLGIGANATMYGIVDRLLLQPPTHVEEPDRVKRVLVERPGRLPDRTSTQASVTYPDYQDLEAASGFDVAAYTLPQEQTMGEGESAIRVDVAFASAELFPLLGVTPRMGRFYTEDEEQRGDPLLVVISHEFWERQYGASPDVLGRTIEISGIDRTIVGVAPEGFTGMDLTPVDVWANLLPSYIAERGEGCLTSRQCWWVQIAARLGPDRALEAAEAEATRLHQTGRAEEVASGRYSDSAGFVFHPLIAAAGPAPSAESRVARWLTGVSVIVLLIACANVTNLLLARGTRRRKETSIRLAMGEGRSRLVALTLVETVGLALLGGAVALLLALWGGALVRDVLLPGVAFPDSAVNGRVVGFTLALSVLAGAAAAVGPALQSRRADVSEELSSSGRGSSGARSRLRSSLTVAQAAMSVVLLVGAGLFVQSLDELHGLDLGLDLDRLVQVRLEFAQGGMDDREQRARYEEAGERVASVPGVRSTAGTAMPLGWSYADPIEVPGLDSIPRLPGGGPYQYVVTEGYFETTGVAVTQGRAIRDADGPGAEPVAVVTETMARTLWPDESAIGRCFMIGRDAESCTTVVGVAEDATRGAYQDEAHMGYYLPAAQVDGRTQALYVRTDGDAEELSGRISQVLSGSMAGVRYVDVTPMRHLLDPQARSWKLGATLFSVFGALALLLAAIGLYSVLAFEVAQRTRELGIRTALGAERGDLLRRVVAEGSRLAFLGVLLGLGAAILAAPYAADLLFQVSPREPSVLILVAVVLVGVGVLASLIPALRATRVDPMLALRAE